MKKIKSPLDVKSHAIACQVLKKDPKKVVSVHDKQDDIAKAINRIDKFKPSFEDPDQEKWTPVFIVDSSGFRFYFSYYDDRISNAGVGSRLCLRFRNKEICEFFAKQHIALHKKAYYK